MLHHERARQVEIAVAARRRRERARHHEVAALHQSAARKAAYRGRTAPDGETAARQLDGRVRERVCDARLQDAALNARRARERVVGRAERQHALPALHESAVRRPAERGVGLDRLRERELRVRREAGGVDDKSVRRGVDVRERAHSLPRRREAERTQRAAVAVKDARRVRSALRERAAHFPCRARIQARLGVVARVAGEVHRARHRKEAAVQLDESVVRAFRLAEGERGVPTGRERTAVHHEPAFPQTWGDRLAHPHAEVGEVVRAAVHFKERVDVHVAVAHVP